MSTHFENFFLPGNLCTRVQAGIQEIPDVSGPKVSVTIKPTFISSMGGRIRWHGAHIGFVKCILMLDFFNQFKTSQNSRKINKLVRWTCSKCSFSTTRVQASLWMSGIPMSYGFGCNSKILRNGRTLTQWHWSSDGPHCVREFWHTDTRLQCKMARGYESKIKIANYLVMSLIVSQGNFKMDTSHTDTERGITGYSFWFFSSNLKFLVVPHYDHVSICLSNCLKQLKLFILKILLVIMWSCVRLKIP